jgi:hypothetical protein
MNVYIGGSVFSIKRLAHESDSQLAARKRFIFTGCPAGADQAEVDRRIHLSCFWHNIAFNGCGYLPDVHLLVDAIAREGAAPAARHENHYQPCPDLRNQPAKYRPETERHQQACRSAPRAGAWPARQYRPAPYRA